MIHSRSSRYRLSLLLAFAAFAAGCGSKPTLKAVRATHARVESTVTTTSAGTVAAEQQAILGFGSTGRVARVKVRAGDRVSKGQVLAELENTDLRTVYEDSERELNRAQELFAAGLVARAALDEATKVYEIARSNHDKSRIRAPYDGIVTEVNLEVGELAQTTGATAGSKTPLRIVDTRPRLIQGTIDEGDLGKVKTGTPARVKIQAAGGKWLNAEVRKVVAFVSTAKEQDRTAEIELRLTGEDKEKPDPRSLPVGASADIELITQEKNQALALPARVALGHGANRYVFRHADGKLARTPIRIGIGNYERIEVLEGVSPGDIVVFPPDEVELKDGMKARTEVQAWP